MHRRDRSCKRVGALVLVVLAFCGQPASAAVAPSPASPVTMQRMTASLMQTPLQFEANRGT